MGFKDKLEKIIDYLPNNERQTMLFSATLDPKIINDISLLALNKPEIIEIHSDEKFQNINNKIIK